MYSSSHCGMRRQGMSRPLPVNVPCIETISISSAVSTRRGGVRNGCRIVLTLGKLIGRYIAPTLMVLTSPVEIGSELVTVLWIECTWCLGVTKPAWSSRGCKVTGKGT